MNIVSRVGVIVEGVSDKIFFDKYFKPNFVKNMQVRTSSTKGTCKILNEKAIEAHIKALRLQGYYKIFILIDLDTQCNSTTYDCILKLKEWYQSKIQISNDTDVIVTVVSKEIESWILSAWEQSDNKSKEDLKRKFQLEMKNKKSLDEKAIFEKFKNSKKHIDRTKNKSLDYFFIKLGIYLILN